MAAEDLFLSGINAAELQPGQVITLEHLRVFHLEEQARQRALLHFQQAEMSRAKLKAEADDRGQATGAYGAAQQRGGRDEGHGGRGGAAAAKQKKVQEEEEPATDQWVQCSKCQIWRQVPDEFWPDIENADEDEDWTCKDALWDVEDYEPGTKPCC
ncbi:hypothetical protein HYH03_004181 [Edaphochlamys debaryana]|uniref:CW-type domain-containing protein n=1 Tax=Edaphochlamys debaryana TaxID=47281 RepID=A0A835YAH3_9CHLO|nr:hypothetical protein HYH03_004181 [Edaphochlamys debaryana]|eukprot:KAG2497917.1 hypothetical protein HYH03_004181 [Edaphochlamys debaryana]